MKPSDIRKLVGKYPDKSPDEIIELVRSQNQQTDPNVRIDPVTGKPIVERKRINTAKVLNNTYFSGDGMGDEYFAPARTMQVSPLVSDQYDFAMTEDIVLLNERKDTAEKLYEIYRTSPYNGHYRTKLGVMKVPKDKIFEIFHYTQKRLRTVKNITAYEMVLAINEFYDFSYDFIYSKVLSPAMKVEILDDYYNNQGMKDRMDQAASDPLF